MPLYLENQLLQAVARRDMEAVSRLLAAGADVNAGLTLDTDTTLSAAIRNGDEAIVRLLLQHGPLVCMAEQEASTQLSRPPRASLASVLLKAPFHMALSVAKTYALHAITGRLPIGSLARSVGFFVCRSRRFIHGCLVIGFRSTSTLGTRALDYRDHLKTMMAMAVCRALYRYIDRPLVLAAALPAPPDPPGLLQDLLISIPLSFGLDAVAMLCRGVARHCGLIDSGRPRWIGRPPNTTNPLDPERWRSQGERVTLALLESESATEGMVVDILRAGALTLQPYDRSEVARKLLVLAVDRCWPELTAFLIRGGAPLDKGVSQKAGSLRWSAAVDVRRYIAPLDSTDHLGNNEFSGRPVLSTTDRYHMLHPASTSTFKELVCSRRFIELTKRPADDADETELASHQAGIAEALRMMDIIHDGGADPLLVDGSGRCAFASLLARRSCSPTVVRHMGELWVRHFRQRSSGDTPEGSRSGSLLLHTAVHTTYPDIDMLRFLLDAGISPESENKEGKTPLFQAAYMNNQTDAMALLLEYGADPNNGGSQGYPPILRTLDDASFEKFTFLLDRGADPNGRKGNQSILEVVLELPGPLSVLKARLACILVQRGAIVFDERRRRSQPLLTAARQSNFAGWDETVLDFLIENIPDSQRQAQLDAALRAACLAIEDTRTYVASTFTILYLLRRGANPNAGQPRSGTLLHLICGVKYVENHRYRREFEALLRRRVLHVNNAQGPGGMGALHLAVKHKSRDFVLLLLKHGANPNLPDAEGSTPLQLICSLAPRGYTISHSVDDVNTGAGEERYRGVRGQAAWAFVNRERLMDIRSSLVAEEIFQMLADYGADMGVVDREGRTLLMKACAQGNSVLAGNILFRLGEQNFARAIQEAGPSGKTALHMAAESGDVNTLRILIDPRQILRAQRNPWRVLAIEGEDRASPGGNPRDEEDDGDDEQPGAVHRTMVRQLRNYVMNVSSTPSFLQHASIHYEKPQKVRLTIGDARRREEERICLPNVSASTWNMTRRRNDLPSSDAPRDGQGRTPLHLAAMGGHRDAVQLLLEYTDMPVAAVDNAGSTAADLALENNFYGIHSMLEEGRGEDTGKE